MKAKYLFFIFLAAAAFYLSSCQKELSYEVGATQSFIDSANTGDSIYLAKYYDTEVLTTGVIDTGMRTTYFYDNLKRVSMILDTIHETGTGYPDDYMKAQYYYNGNDQLPYKCVTFSNDILNPIFHSQDTLTNFYFYDTASRLIRDSSVSSASGLQPLTSLPYYFMTNQVSRYTYSSNIIYGYTERTVLQSINATVSTPFIRRDTCITDAAGNIISARYSTAYTGGTGYSRISTFTYDNNPSPLSKLNISKLKPFFYDGFQDVAPGFTYHNNILKIETFTLNSGTTEVFDYTGIYSYKQNGLPSKFRYTDYEGNGIFIYKSL